MHFMLFLFQPMCGLFLITALVSLPFEQVEASRSSHLQLQLGVVAWCYSASVMSSSRIDSLSQCID